MEMSARVKDPFRERIWEILLGESTGKARDGFKSRVFTEVQNYSRELQEAEYDSDFFFRLLELIIDCRSLSIPDESFRITVALCYSNPKTQRSRWMKRFENLSGWTLPATK